MDQIQYYKSEIERLNGIIEQKDALITRRIVEEKGLEFLQKWNYVLPEDPERRAAHLEILFEKLQDKNTRLKVDGTRILVVDANGEPKENEAGTRELSFDALIASKADRIFEKKVSDQRQSPANKATFTGSGNDMPPIQTMEDFYQALYNEPDITRQKALKEHLDKLIEIGAIKE